jgi:hypothetical protein
MLLILIAFYDIHGRKREVLFLYFVPDTTRDSYIFIKRDRYSFFVTILSSFENIPALQLILVFYSPPGTGMTSEALGVSVAPSFFHSCVSDGKTATMEDVQRFKVGTLL